MGSSIMKPLFFWIALSVFLNYASALMPSEYESDGRPVKIFYYEEDTRGWHAVIKGMIISLSVREDTAKDSMTQRAQDRTKATVRLSAPEGLKAGDILYVIDDKNLVVAKMETRSIFRSQSFGYLLVGYGHMRLARTGYRVAQRREEELSKYAYIYKARGDYFQNIGDPAESINHYKKALELDKGNPEAHLELGNLYLKDNMLQFAFREYSEAYKNIGRLYDKEDRYNLLIYMAETRYREAYFTTLPSALRSSYIKEGIKYAREALGLYPDSVQANNYLGTFYFKSDEPSDVDAKNHFLKVIQGDPGNIEARVSLAELYYNHKNREKALYYAVEALKIDGTHERARLIKELSQK